MIGTKPYTYENSCNPWLLDCAIDKNIIINEHELTAAYLWSLNDKEREEMLERVFQYYRKKGFPYIVYTGQEAREEYNKLIQKDPYSCFTGENIKNSGNICLDLTKAFCHEKYYCATTDKGIPPLDVFNNDELFRKVLKNRMGWNTSCEDGTERPYIFAINDKNIRAGIRNSGIGREVSNFRPLVAKFMYKHAADLLYKDDINVFDYSGGWGARAMGAGSLGYNYSCVDPNTHHEIKTICNAFNINTLGCLELGSENSDLINIFGEKSFDCCGSCPSYFNMERYSDSETQCYNEYNDYKTWLEEYWRPTVKNCNVLMKDTAVFQLVVKDIYGKCNLKDDMMNIVQAEINNIVLVEEISYTTTKSHLSGKRRTGVAIKSNEYLINILRKNI